MTAALLGFAGLTALAATLSVVHSKVVHAALWLVVSLGGLAAVYLVLGAEVVGLVQLLVYVGAVVVLILFALMLTRAPASASEQLDLSRPRQGLAALIAGLTTAVVFLTLHGSGFTEADPAALGDHGRAHALGTELFSNWVLPFELLSVLLLAALVAAVLISRGGRR